MKNILSILIFSLLLASCSTDDSTAQRSLGVHDVIFHVSSTDETRLSQIDFKIMNSGTDVHHSSYSNNHLPLTRNFQAQEIKEFTKLEIGYLDNSGGAVGIPFEPYDVIVRIEVDGKVIAEKEFTVTDSGQVSSVTYDFFPSRSIFM